MTPVQKAVAYILEKAKNDTPAERAAIYRIAAELTPEAELERSLIDTAESLELAEKAQLNLEMKSVQFLSGTDFGG